MPNVQSIANMCLLIGLLFPFTSQASETLHFNNAWSPEAPSVAKVLAGYFRVENKGNKEILITEITSPQFKSIEIHRTLHENGMAKMIWQPHIHVPVGRQVILEPGGKHLMMIKPKQRLKAGDNITLHITLSNNKKQTIQAKVRKR